MTFKKTLIALSLLAASGSAMANETGYIGVATGSVSYNYSDVNDSTPLMIYGGFRQYNNPVGVEIAYLDFGNADITSSPGDHLNMSGFNISATLSTAGYSRSPLSFFGKLGFYSLKTTSTVVAADDSGTGLSWGLGLEFAPARQVAFRAEVQGFNKVPDQSLDQSVAMISMGVNVKF